MSKSLEIVNAHIEMFKNCQKTYAHASDIETANKYKEDIKIFETIKQDLEAYEKLKQDHDKTLINNGELCIKVCELEKENNELKETRLTYEKLKELLELHNLWLKDNNKGKRLDLSGRDLRHSDMSCLLYRADLRYANLSHTNLYGANLSRANLNDANLSGANLIRANLKYTKLNYTSLYDANLSYANLSHAHLHGTNLGSANLFGTKLKSANLSFANLGSSNLRYANLEGANLQGTTFYDANFYSANFNNAKDIPYIRLTCPDTGSFIGWKKVNGYIVKLRIPAKAKRCSATTNKCRCSFAKVLDIQDLYGKHANINEVTNIHYAHCTYKIGEIVYPDSFDENRWNECSNGIYFFINREDAVRY